MQHLQTEKLLLNTTAVLQVCCFAAKSSFNEKERFNKL